MLLVTPAAPVAARFAATAPAAPPEAEPAPVINGAAAMVPAARNVISGTLLADGVAAIDAVGRAVAAAAQLSDSVAASVPAATARTPALGAALALAARLMVSTWKRKVEATKPGAPEIATKPTVVAAPLEFTAPDPVTGAVARTTCTRLESVAAAPETDRLALLTAVE